MVDSLRADVMIPAEFERSGGSQTDNRDNTHDRFRDPPRLDPAEVLALFKLPFNDLLFQAQSVHRQYFDPNRVQVSTLLSIKTGACPEDCKYCPQSGHYNTGLDKEKLMEVEKVLQAAADAKAIGSTRFCMGAPGNTLCQGHAYVPKMVEGVKALGLETCMTRAS